MSFRRHYLPRYARLRREQDMMLIERYAARRRAAADYDIAALPLIFFAADDLR